MGKSILALGLLVSLSFSIFIHVIPRDNHGEEILTLLKGFHHQEKLFYSLSVGENVKVAFKIPLFRNAYTQWENSSFSFEYVRNVIKLSADFDDFGKEQLSTFLYPAHTFP